MNLRQVSMRRLPRSVRKLFNYDNAENLNPLHIFSFLLFSYKILLSKGFYYEMSLIKAERIMNE
jgi:hypothetical protein